MISYAYSAEPTIALPNDEELYNKANPKMIWGEPTNFFRADFAGRGPLLTSLRSALDVSNGAILLSGHPLRPRHPVHILIENFIGSSSCESPTKFNQGVPTFSEDPTNVVNAFMPVFNDRLALNMTDSRGAPVLRTHEGMLLNQTPDFKQNTPWREFKKRGFGIFPKQLSAMPISDKAGSAASILPGAAAAMWELDPTKYFLLNKPGLYTLTLVQRVYVIDTNEFLKVITLPPVAVPVSVESN